MKRIIFKRAALTDPFKMQDGEWVPAILNGKKSAYIKAPGIHFGSIAKHEISPNGEVNPSVMITDGQKTFHEFITLEGWSEGWETD